MENNLPFLTLDKSYLQSCSSSDLAEQSSLYRFVLPEALAYEVVKHSAKDRSELFRKFPSSAEPYTVAHSISRMLNDEAVNKLPYSHEDIGKRDLSMHDKLASADFNLPDNFVAVLERRRCKLDEEAPIVLSQAEVFRDQFPYAFKGAEATRTEARLAARAEIISEVLVKERYAYIASRRASHTVQSIPPETLTPKWATFRWVQLFGLLAWDVITRYPDLDVLRSSKKALEKLNHDILDSHTLLTALAVGGDFAMQEKKWRSVWDLLSPNGSFISKT